MMMIRHMPTLPTLPVGTLSDIYKVTLKLCITRKNTTRRHESHNGARNTYLNTSYLIPIPEVHVCTHIHIHVHHTPRKYLTLPYLYKNIKHLTTAPSSSLDGTTLPTPTTPTVLGPSQYKPPYLPTYPPTLSAKGARGESSIGSFYKSGRHQFQFHSLASTINRLAS